MSSPRCTDPAIAVNSVDFWNILLLMFKFVVLVMGVQLMLLPELLRGGLAEDVPIGFYLTSPFPSSEVYRCLPRTH